MLFAVQEALAQCAIQPSGSRPEGTIIYNRDHEVFQGCEGTQWVALRVSGNNFAPPEINCPADAAGANVTSGLIHRWEFNEGSGTSAANSVGAQAGTLTGGASWAAGVYGTAVDLDGTGYVALGTMDISGSAMSITAWVKSGYLVPDDFRIISKASSTSEADHYWMLGTENTIAPRIRLKTGGTTNTLSQYNQSYKFLQSSTWQLFGLTYDGSTMRIYVDGTEVRSTAKTGALSTNNAIAAAIGRNGSDNSGRWRGLIDDVRIYDRALSAAEVKDLFDHGNSALCN